LAQAPVAIAAGLVSVGISAFYIWRVTASQPGFALAFGEDWQQKISLRQESHMLKKRWNIGLPQTKEPRWERDLAIWTIPGTDRELLCDIWQPPGGVTPSGLAFVYLHGSAWYILDKDFGTRPLFRHLAAQKGMW
jgi:acetyl esterase/lipase